MNDNTMRSGEGSALNNARDTIRATAADLASQAKEKADEQIDSKLGMARTEINSIASALRRVGDQIRDEKGSGIAAGVFTAIADRAETLGSAFEGRDFDGLMSDVSRLAHRNPAAFAGTAAALGFLAVRFLKSSGRTFQSSTGQSYNQSYNQPFNPSATKPVTPLDYPRSNPAYGAGGLSSTGFNSGSLGTPYGSGNKPGSSGSENV